MDFETAVDVISTHYGKDSKIPQYLGQKAIITMANLCNEKVVRHVADHTLVRLSAMDEDRQSAWLANPFLQWIMESVESSCYSGTAAAPSPAPTLENKKTVKPVDKKKDEEEEDDNLFGLFDDDNKKGKKKEEEEDDDDMGMSLFD